MPMKYQVRVTNILHLATQFVLSHLWPLTYSLKTSLLFIIYANHLWNCMNITIHNAYCYEVLSESEIFHSWQLYLFFHAYAHLSIPCFTVILDFSNAYEVLGDIHVVWLLFIDCYISQLVNQLFPVHIKIVPPYQTWGILAIE